MAFFAPYNPPIDSTAGVAASPSTTALLAELDSTNFGYPSTGPMRRGDRLYGVNIWVGGSTAANWVIEHCISTAIHSTALAEQALTVWTASGQTSQFVKVFKLAPDERIRVRHVSSVTGSFQAYLQAQELA